MSEAFAFISGKNGPAIARYLHDLRAADVANTDESIDNLLQRFFENAVNTRWARFWSPGWFGRKTVDRAGSDSLFFTIYKREGGYDSWPMWAIHWLAAYADEIDRRRYRDDIFKNYVSLFESGVDVYLPQKFFTGILRLDKFFIGENPPLKPLPIPTSS